MIGRGADGRGADRGGRGPADAGAVLGGGRCSACRPWSSRSSRRSQPTPAGSCWPRRCVHAPFYFYVSYAMIRYLFHDDRVTRDELFATGAAFTVVAWAFAYVYAAAQVDLAGLLRRRRRGRPAVVQPAVPVLHQPDQRRALRRRADRRARPLVRDGRAAGRRALRRAGGRPPGRAHAWWPAVSRPVGPRSSPAANPTLWKAPSGPVARVASA